jgi:SAM-dependent methyltransferase
MAAIARDVRSGNRAASGTYRSNSDSVQIPLVLVPSRCFLCSNDDAEPIAVGEDFHRNTSPDTFLAVRCRKCGLVYLNPCPAPGELDRIHRLTLGQGRKTLMSAAWQSGRTLAREIARFCENLPDRTRLLDLSVGDPSAVHLAEELGHAAQSYDAILAVNVLERAAEPLATLKAIQRLLRPGGIALIVTPNTDSGAGRVFGGRHWSGYDFPRHRNLFRTEVLAQAAAIAGLESGFIRTIAAPAAWVQSARNALVDWRAPSWTLAAFDRLSLLPLAAAAAIEWWHQLRGKGGLLLATLRRPAG